MKALAWSLALTPPLLALSGYAFQKLWLWFVVPSGFKVLGLGEAIGLYIIANLLTAQYSPHSGETNESVERILDAFSRPLYALVIGRIVLAVCQ